MFAKITDLIKTVQTVDKAVTSFHEREDAASYSIAEMVKYPDGIERLADILGIDDMEAQTIAQRYKATA